MKCAAIFIVNLAFLVFSTPPIENSRSWTVGDILCQKGKHRSRLPGLCKNSTNKPVLIETSLDENELKINLTELLTLTDFVRQKQLQLQEVPEIIPIHYLESAPSDIADNSTSNQQLKVKSKQISPNAKRSDSPELIEPASVEDRQTMANLPSGISWRPIPVINDNRFGVMAVMSAKMANVLNPVEQQAIIDLLNVKWMESKDVN